MTLAIVGAGLATPFGLSPKEHVLFQRAFVPGPAASPFLGPEDRRVRAYHCDWLDAALPLDERMPALAAVALEDALRPLDELGVVPGLALVVPASRPGLDGATIGRAAAAIRQLRKFASVRIHSGEAGSIAALAELDADAERRGGAPTVVLAVDSFIDADVLHHRTVVTPPTRWEAARPIPSEAAAAVVVVPSRRATHLGLRPLATVTGAATGSGAARDDNDELADGATMTALIERVAPRHVSRVFGQERLDPLRNADWNRACMRHGDRFWDCQHTTVEARLGAVGAASAAASIVVGLFSARLHVEPTTTDDEEPFLAWALSQDGTRGVVGVRVGEA